MAGMYRQPHVDDGRPGRNLTALGEEQRVLDGGEAGRGSQMSSRYCSECRWRTLETLQYEHTRSSFSHIGCSHNID